MENHTLTKLGDHLNPISKNILLAQPINACPNQLLLITPSNPNTSYASYKPKSLPQHPITPHASFERLLKLKSTQIILIEKMDTN
jgi:hypothetical protein